MHYGDGTLIFTANRICNITYKQSVYIKATSNCLGMYNCERNDNYIQWHALQLLGKSATASYIQTFNRNVQYDAILITLDAI